MISKKNNKEIGTALAEGLKESEKLNILGKCNKCDGELIMRRSKIGKAFVGCSSWPKCNNTYPLPQYAKIIPMNKVCEKCGTPKVKVFSKGKVFEMCLDTNCETKKNWGKKEESAVVKDVEKKDNETKIATKKETKKKTVRKTSKTNKKQIKNQKKETIE